MRVELRPMNPVVEVWTVRLDQHPEPAEVQGLDLLSPDERRRAEAFNSTLARTAYASTRVVLRQVLAQASGVSPREIKFQYGPRGRPSAFLRSGDNLPLDFNVSHSGGLALIAVGFGCRVGVDVEQVRDLPDLEHLLHLVCSESEHRRLAALSFPERVGEFFWCWTAKEAILKASGEGLGRDPTTLELGMESSPGRAPQIRLLAPTPNRWQLHSWAPLAEYRACLAVDSPAATVAVSHRCLRPLSSNESL